MTTRSHVRLGVLAVCAALVSACGGGGDAETTPTKADTNRCVLDPPSAATKAITAGLDEGVDLAKYAVIVATDPEERVDTGWPKAVYAALLTGKGSGAATWAMDDPATGAGPIVAISDPARKWSTYPDAGGDSGSSRTRRTIAGLEATVSARACVLD